MDFCKKGLLIALIFVRIFHTVPALAADAYVSDVVVTNRIAKIAVAASIVYALSRWIQFDTLIASIFYKIFLLVLFPMVLYSVGFFVSDEKAKIKSTYRKATQASLHMLFLRGPRIP